VFHRILFVLCCVFGVACVANSEPVATSTAHLTDEPADFGVLLDELVVAQRSQPTKELVDVDPESVIKYSSLEEVMSIAAKTCDAASTEIPSATCSAATAGEQAWLEKENGCTKRKTCKLAGPVADPSVSCRTCMTCCDVRDSGTTCNTSCTNYYIVRVGPAGPA
jgi:hypothetical protein